MANTIQSNLYLLRELITCGQDIFFWTFDAGFSLRYTNCPAEKYYAYIFDIDSSTAELIRQLAENNKPAVMTSAAGLLWIVDFERDSLDELLFCHVVGPVYVDEISQRRIDSTIKRLSLPRSEKQELRHLLCQFPIVPITRYYDYGLMLHYCITGEKINYSDFQYPKMEPAESNTNQSSAAIDSYSTWIMEQNLLRLIEDGNPDYKKQSSHIVGLGHIGQLGNGDPIRHLKNLTIIFTAMSARAAIKGGLTPEIAYTLSDKYISGIEASSTVAEITEINTAMQDDFVSRVHQYKLDSSSFPQVQNCCNYLQLHLSEKISIPELAAKMGYSSSYLAKIFKKETGMTINEYIMSLKIQQAQGALRLSDESIQNICNQLGFCSQSYFGVQFKKITGMSPLEYRQRQGMPAK